MNRVRTPELVDAGAWAHNRWLADFMAPSGGRLLGVAEPGTCHDMDRAVEELRWAAANGFVSVTMPGQLHDPSLPPLDDAYFAPFFAACEELGLVLSIHAGWGGVQGAFLDADTPATKQDSPLRLTWSTRRPLWQLMVGGVFDRHPELRLAFTEVRADWVPDTVALLNRLVAERGVQLPMVPSEYYRRHVVVTPSSIHRAEVELRHEIGDDQLLFGADYPHWEGTWPNTQDWIRTAFASVPAPEAVKILGENALATYRLDEARLRAVAGRIGPDASLLDAGAADDALVEHFHQRSGYRRPADPVDLDDLTLVVSEDLVALDA